MNGLYSSQSLFVRNHYGKLLKNESTDLEIEFSVKYSRLVNLELDGSKGNTFVGKVGPGDEAFCMLRPMEPGEVSLAQQTEIKYRKI